jgi:hypothetical protein
VNEIKPMDAVFGEEAARLGADVIHGRRPDVIHLVKHQGAVAELHVGILELSTGKIRPSFTVVLTKLQASIHGAMLRTRCRFADVLGTPEAGEKVYNVIAESHPLGADGYVVTFGAFDRPGKQWQQIGQVILADGERRGLAVLLSGSK